MLVKPQSSNVARIKVVGVGGAGGNAINNMIQNYDIEGVEFVAVNTDSQALANNSAEVKLKIGEEITRGLGSGGNPQIGRKAAEESVDLLHENLAGSDMVFITAGMGGGTGTGASPVVAGISKNLGALTVGIVEKPFNFEGKRRMSVALEGITQIKEKVDTLIVIPNQRLLDVIDRNISFFDAMRMVDDVLAQAVKSISQLITQHGIINLDFADVRSVMSNAGTALMGMGTASGDDRATEAMKQAMNSPLLEMTINGATGVLFNVIGGKDLAMYEIDEAAKLISEAVDPDANVIFGAHIDPEMQDEIMITVLATGFDLDETGTPIPMRQSARPQQTQGAYSNDNYTPTQQSVPARPVLDDSMDDSDDSSEDDLMSPPPLVSKPKRTSASLADEDEDDLETPSFLRRKKDY
ncbi:MAG: Cell division protein FtsZ [candidate division WS6 bacterium OLB20]|uniref:Cell division protein FtsZ n=1 Tax=candidate division WS6 bacterium OLB20 TaxID=1617426 RepID=A0A136LZH3_9BACT|nr:MAG: Cell division protein FtsZ [candidate division WS6 bacterium OLB20]